LFFHRGRKAAEVERKAAEEGGLICAGREGEAGDLELVRNEGVDGIANCKMQIANWGSVRADRLEGPEGAGVVEVDRSFVNAELAIFGPGGAGGDPCAESFDLALGEGLGFFGVGRGHFARDDALEKEAFGGIAGDERRALVPAL
jgi:hypothetical protein